MLVLATLVHVEVVEELSTQTVLGEHALHYAAEEFVSAVGLSHDGSGSVLALSAGVAGVSEVNTIGPLLAGEADLVGIDDDDVVAAVHVGSKVGLILTAQQFGNLGAKTAENLVGSIHYDPLFLCGLFVSRNGLVT